LPTLTHRPAAFVVKPVHRSLRLTYLANPDYWQPGEPKSSEGVYPAFTSNDPANTYLPPASPVCIQFIPNLQPPNTRSRRTTTTVPPIANSRLISPTSPGVLSDPGLPACYRVTPIDRNKVAIIGEYCENRLEPERHRPLPPFSALDGQPRSAGKYNYGYQPPRQSAAAQAGYTLGGERL